MTDYTIDARGMEVGYAIGWSVIDLYYDHEYDQAVKKFDALHKKHPLVSLQLWKHEGEHREKSEVVREVNFDHRRALEKPRSHDDWLKWSRSRAK